jgi:hypothetical protein
MTDKTARPSSSYIFFLAIVTIVFSVAYLQVIFRWWYEDNPGDYAMVAALPSGWTIFSSPAVVKGFGTGASAIPMQILSFWVDVKLFGISPFAAYCHNLLALLIVAILMYKVLERYTEDRVVSTGITVLWLLLPSTIAVHYFIATRHYMEGLGWSLLVLYCLHRTCQLPDGKRDTIGLLVIFFGSLAALLSKEIYVTTLPTFVFLYSLNKRRYKIAASAVLVVIVYAAYRQWLVGGGHGYPVPQLSVGGYLKYLAILPYTFSANWWGYLGYGGLAALGVHAVMAKRSRDRKVVGLIVLLLLGGLLATYPTAEAVLDTYRTPGTWYRSPFIINTLVMLSGGYLLSRYAPRRLQALCAIILLVLQVPGVHATRTYWTQRLLQAEREGKFYLANPDKLVLSQEEAYWFLSGIDQLYKIPQAHHIAIQNLNSEHARKMLSLYPQIWRLENGNFWAERNAYDALTLH